MAAKGKVTVIVIASFVIYLLLSTTLFFSTPFMVSWGSEPSWYIKVIGFLQNTPFKLTGNDGEITLSLMFVNALFWTLCLAGVFWLILVNKKKEAQQ
ncbi:MAG: hypothetical protein Kow0079_18400 [Vicingaceae bacterium]